MRLPPWKLVEREFADTVIVDVKSAAAGTGGDEPRLEAVRALVARGRIKILLNLRDVEYIDSESMGEIVKSFSTAQNAGGTLKLVAANDRIRQLLVVTKLDRVIEVFNSEAAAVHAIVGGQFSAITDMPVCDCFDQYSVGRHAETRLHAEQQDTASDGWKRLLELIEQAAADGRAEFMPQKDMTVEQWKQIVTLPPAIRTLKAVKRFVMYESWLVRMPPEIGDMGSLESFEPYRSHRLHWFPYEITRCPKLRRTIVSTRSLYGNHKIKPPFPKLPTSEAAAAACSICGLSLDGKETRQAWLSTRVGTDVLPLLVNACSDACISRLPPGAENLSTALRPNLT